MTLQAFLAAVLSGSIAMGPLVYALIEYAGVGSTLAPHWKRVAAAVLSGIVGICAWAVSFALGYISAPETAANVAEALWTHGVLSGFAAFTTATAIHGFTHSPKGLRLEKLAQYTDTLKPLVGEPIYRDQGQTQFNRYERCAWSDCERCQFNPTCAELDDHVDQALVRQHRGQS